MNLKLWSCSVSVLLCFSLVVSFIGTRAISTHAPSEKTFYDMLQCNLCDSARMQGRIADCQCEFEKVNEAVEAFFVPQLRAITSRTFFRYFKVEFHKPCPFWDEDGQCAFEGCSVGTCDMSEIPSTWIGKNYDRSFEGGWVSHEDDCLWRNSSQLEKQSHLSSISEHGDHVSHSEYLEFLRNDRSISSEVDWTDMSETNDFSSGTYVNLLENPERFTGYSGPSARRVWTSITEENCFGEAGDSCLEKRVFFRIMSGLRASISTHIAREYFYHDNYDSGRWGVNLPLFVQAVGSHPERIDNMYFTFLFLLRAVTKARDALINFPFSTGNLTEDALTRHLVSTFLSTSNISNLALTDPDHIRDSSQAAYNQQFQSVDECRNGFDESSLFQVNNDVGSYGTPSWIAMSEKTQLLEDFRDKFRNITRIMDCVTCQKCRLWGKLQILGIGTAIKILLSPSERIHEPNFVTRQEVVALLNVLHQIARSVQFAARAPDYELKEKLTSAAQGMGLAAALAFVCAGVGIRLGFFYRKKYEKRVQN